MVDTGKYVKYSAGGQSPQTVVGANNKMVQAPRGDAMLVRTPDQMKTLYGPKPVQPTIDPVGNAKSKEWELLRKQAAGNIALAASESDIAKAERLQETHEQAYRSGTEAGTRAYGAMEQRALDEAGQVRMGAMNEAYSENTQAELAQTSKDVAEQKTLANEQYQANHDRLQSEYEAATTTPERKQEIARALDALEAQHFGQAPATGSWQDRVSVKTDSVPDAEARTLAPIVQSALGITDPASALSIAKVANQNGITTLAEMGKYKAFLTDPRIIANPTLVNDALAQFEQGNYDGLDWGLITKSPEWKMNKGQYVTHLTEPTGKVSKGDTLMLSGYNGPLVVTKNPSGEGFYAKSLESGQTVWVEDWSAGEDWSVFLENRNKAQNNRGF